MKYLSLFFAFFYTTILFAQKYTISGYIRDANSGEDLIYANVYNLDNTIEGASSNIYGFYSLTLPSGNYKLLASYLGYENQEIKLELQGDTSMNFYLEDNSIIDSTIVITAKQTDEHVQSTQMGTIEISIETAKKIPALLGEIDILKTIQLLPGVLSSGEGNAGFYVRGGGVDQNLILLDNAVVYNSGHLLGFFSVFNADAIKNTTLIKGGDARQLWWKNIFRFGYPNERGRL